MPVRDRREFGTLILPLSPELHPSGSVLHHGNAKHAESLRSSMVRFSGNDYRAAPYFEEGTVLFWGSHCPILRIAVVNPVAPPYLLPPTVIGKVRGCELDVLRCGRSTEPGRAPRSARSRGRRAPGRSLPSDRCDWWWDCAGRYRGSTTACRAPGCAGSLRR